MFLSRLSINNPVFIIMLTLALMIFGMVGYSKMGTDMFPNVDIPYVTITAIYPGADSRTVENDVVKKIEDVVATLPDIKHINGVALSNVGQVVIQFNDKVEVNRAAQDVRDKIATIMDTLPKDVETPQVEKIDLQAIPVLSLVMKAPPGENMAKITDIAEKKIKNVLQTINGVGSVDMYGGREREIKVLMNPLKVAGYNMSAGDIVNIMRSRFTEIPAGTVKMNKDTEEIVVKSNSEPAKVSDIENTPVASIQGNSILVKDIARVEDGLEEEKSASFLDKTAAVGLQVQKQRGVNVVKMAETVKAEIEKIRKTLPEGYGVEIVSDNSPFIKKAITSSIEDVFIGALLAVLIIFLFLRNTRASFIVATALPASIIGTFLFIYAVGYTLNYMTTLALSLSVGLLVDDAIVIIENIFRHMEMGKKRVQAVLDATQEIGLAVLAVTLTLVAVFGPIVYMEGMIGKMFQAFGLTVSVAVLISLVVSFTVTPLLSSMILKEESQTFFLYRWMEKLLIFLENGYAKMISLALKQKLLTFIVAVALFVGGLSMTGLLKKTFIDKQDQGTFDINIELPGESSIDLGKDIAAQVADKINVFEWKELMFTTIGGGARSEKNKILFRVKMKDRNKRTATQFTAMDDSRKALDFLKEKYNARISVTEKDELGGGHATPIQFNIAGTDFDLLKQDAAKVLAFMGKDGAFTDIINSDQGLRKEIKIKLNHTKMNDLGVNPVETAATLRYLFSGEKIANYKESGEMYEMKVYADTPFKDLDFIKNISLRGSGREMVRMGDIADVSYGASEVIINRMERARIIKITASLNQGYDLGGQVNKLKDFAAENFNKEHSVFFGGDAEMMKDTFSSLLGVLITAIFLIYIILASQYNSFIHPFSIMAALPFAVTGAFGSLYLTGQSLGLMSFIGLIMLMGIVTKNSILIVDFTLQKKRFGMDTTKALIEAGRVRLRPILMTTLATIFGMLPVAISSGEGSEIKHPMAYAVIGGVIFSTIVTLFVVPVIFYFFDNIAEFFVKKMAKKEENHSKPEHS